MVGSGPSKVLVIDDDEMVRTIARKLLEAEMFAVDVSPSGREALARLPYTSYDVILCDMWMPGMTGKDFYNRLKEEFPEYQDRIIFLTGDMASEATWDFIEKNNLPYVLKPINVAEMRRKLRQLVGEGAGPEEALAAATPAPAKGAESRRHRRIAMKVGVRVRKKKWGGPQPEVTSVTNASKEGVYFLSEGQYRVGTDVLVAFPYTGANDLDQEGCVVRVDERSDGRRGVAVALGPAAEAARTACGPSSEERKRQRILALADLTTEMPRTASVTEEITETSDLKLQLAHERQKARRLEQELADLRTIHQRLVSERDRLAAEQADHNWLLRELTSSKATLSETVEDLKRQVATLNRQLAARLAERDQAETKLPTPGVAEKGRAAESPQQPAALEDVSRLPEVEELKRQVAALQNQLAAALAERDHVEEMRATADSTALADAARRQEVEDLKRQVATLQNQFAGARAERDQVEEKLQAALEGAQKWRAAESLRRQEAVSSAGSSVPADASREQESEMEVTRLREQLKALEARIQELHTSCVGPLTILAAYVEMLPGNESLDREAQETLAEIRQQASLLLGAFQKFTRKN